MPARSVFSLSNCKCGVVATVRVTVDVGNLIGGANGPILGTLALGATNTAAAAAMAVVGTAAAVVVGAATAVVVVVGAAAVDFCVGVGAAGFGAATIVANVFVGASVVAV